MFTSRLQNERTDVLVRALLSLNNEEEVYRVLEDLLTIREVGSFPSGWKWPSCCATKPPIPRSWKRRASPRPTIGRVNRCLNYGAGGYQLIFEKLSEEEK